MTEPTDQPGDVPEVPPPPPGGYPPPPAGGYPPPPPPGGYPPPVAGGYLPPYPGYAATPRNGLGIAALVLGVIAVPACMTLFGGVLLGIVAAILGFLGWSRAKSGEADNGGVAIAGALLGVVAVVISIGLAVFGISFFKSIGGGDYVHCMQQAGDDTAAQNACAEKFQQRIEDKYSITLTPMPTP